MPELDLDARTTVLKRTGGNLSVIQKDVTELLTRGGKQRCVAMAVLALKNVLV